MPTIISITNLSKTYASGLHALKAINLDISKGEILALLGPNGAGKTTLISIVCGIVNSSGGTVTVGGYDILKDYRATRSLIGLVPQELTTDMFETVWDTVSFSRGVFGLPANRAHIEGKRVILVDDSIVRGTTSMKIVEMVRNAGAREVHMRIAAPPTTDPCFYGIDTPEREKLLASRYDVAGMAKFIGVDSLAFLSIDGLYRAMGLPGRDPNNPGFCDACFTGDDTKALDDVTGVEHRQL